MPNEAHDITRYTFADSEHLLLDTNVWMLAYGPNKPGDRRVAVYSGALARMLAARSAIHSDVLILSEFINRYARLKYNILRSTGGTAAEFKQFRDSAGFKPVAQEIADAARRVLGHCARMESGFASVDIVALMTEYEKGNSDFNDQMLTELCKSQGLTFVTDDGDFRGSGLKLVTGNKRLLV